MLFFGSGPSVNQIASAAGTYLALKVMNIFYHTLSMTQSGISLPFACAGAAADVFFSGPGRSICTVRLNGPDVYIFV